MSFIVDDQLPSGIQTPVMQPRRSSAFNDAEPLLSSSSVVDVKEDDQSILLSIEMPGVLGKDICVNVQRGILSIRGFRCVKDSDGRVVKRHRLCRRFSVDTDVVDVNRATANIWNGVLNLYAPKKNKPITVTIPVTEMPDCAFSAEIFGRGCGGSSESMNGPCRIPDDADSAAH